MLNAQYSEPDKVAATCGAALADTVQTVGNSRAYLQHLVMDAPLLIVESRPDSTRIGRLRLFTVLLFCDGRVSLASNTVAGSCRSLTYDHGRAVQRPILILSEDNQFCETRNTQGLLGLVP